MSRTNKEIYAEAKMQASNIMSTEQIALNAMHTLKKELESEFKQKLEELGVEQEEEFIDYGEKR